MFSGEMGEVAVDPPVVQAQLESMLYSTIQQQSAPQQPKKTLLMMAKNSTAGVIRCIEKEIALGDRVLPSGASEEELTNQAQAAGEQNNLLKNMLAQENNSSNNAFDITMMSDNSTAHTVEYIRLRATGGKVLTKNNVGESEGEDIKTVYESISKQENSATLHHTLQDEYLQDSCKDNEKITEKQKEEPHYSGDNNEVATRPTHIQSRSSQAYVFDTLNSKNPQNARNPSTPATREDGSDAIPTVTMLASGASATSVNYTNQVVTPAAQITNSHVSQINVDKVCLALEGPSGLDMFQKILTSIKLSQHTPEEKQKYRADNKKAQCQHVTAAEETYNENDKRVQLIKEYSSLIQTNPDYMGYSFSDYLADKHRECSELTFENVNVHRENLLYGDFKSTTLEDAFLTETTLDEVTLTGTNLNGTKLCYSTGLTARVLSKARYDAKTPIFCNNRQILMTANLIKRNRNAKEQTKENENTRHRLDQFETGILQKTMP